MVKLLCAFLLVAILSSCVDPDNRHRSAEELVNELMVIWQSGDTSLLVELMSPDVVYDDIPNGITLRGIEASSAYVAHVHSWASEIEITINRSFGDKSDAVAEWTMTAIQSSPIPGRVPIATGNQIILRGATIIHVEEGKITSAADYLDALGFVLQLGGEVTLPGGVIMGGPEE